MSWGVIAGTERLIPNSANNEMKLEAGKPKKFRLLLKAGEEPFSFFEHTVDNEKVENGQTTNVFRTIVCPKNKQNPYAPCKLCDGQQVKRRIRHAANVWEYDSSSVRILKGGEDIWKPIATLVSMGVDVTTLDFVVTRTGQGRNDTQYSTVSLGPATTPLDINSLTLFDIAQEYAPHSEEDMKGIIEAVGLNWNTVIVPPAVKYPATLQECLDHVIPNTKYKGQTMKQVWDTNRGMIEFFAKSTRISDEKAMAQAILVNLGGAMIGGVPIYNGSAPITPAANPQPAPQANVSQHGAQPGAPAVGNTPTGPAPSDVRNQKIAEINKLLQSNDKFIKGGYTVIVDTMKQASNGKVSINEFTDAELDKMIELCK